MTVKVKDTSIMLWS